MAAILDPVNNNSSRAIAVRTGQPIRMVADSSTDWWINTNGGGWSQLNTPGVHVSTYTYTPSSVTRKFTFDDVQIGVNTNSAPGSANLYLNVVDGPVTVLHATDRIRNEALQEPPLNPNLLESDDPPLGFPLGMPGANRDGFGTVLLERAYEAGGPANLVSLYGPGLFLDSSGKLGSRTPIAKNRGLGPFPTIASYHHAAYLNYDFGKGRMLSLTRRLEEESASPYNVAVIRGDGRKNTFRYHNYDSGSGVTYYDAAASLRNSLYKAGSYFQETTPSGTYYVYNVSGSLKGRIDRVLDRNGNPVYYLYDANNRLQKVQGLSGAQGLVPYLAYDANGLCSMLCLQDNGNAANNRTWYYTYDGNTNLLKAIGPELCVTYFEYGTGAPPTDFLTASTDPMADRWVVGYDGNNRVNAIADALGQPAYFAWDTTNAVATWKDRTARATYYAFNAFGSPTSAFNVGTPADYYTYDSDGNLLTAKNRVGNQWTFEYDGKSNRISSTDPLAARSYYAYDGQNLLRTYIDPLNRSVYLNFDASRNRTSQQDPTGNTTYWGYQSSGLIQYRKDRLGNFSYWRFDGAANNDCVVDALGFKTYYEYNSAGEPTKVFDARSNATYMSYDFRGRVTQVKDPYLNTKLFSYDAACNLTTAVDENAHSSYHSYDGNHNRTKTVRDMGGGAYLFTYYRFDAEDRLAGQKDANLNETYWLYDGLGRREKQVDALGNETYWVYDDAHELTIEQPPAQSAGVSRLATYYSYDVVGRRQQTIDAAQLLTYLSFDAKGNVSFTNVDQGWGRQPWGSSPYGGERATTYYAYDSLDRRTRVTDAYGRHSYWEFDAEGNVTKTLNAASPTRLAMYYDYDARNRQMHSSDNLHFAQTYIGYDAVGNVVRQIDALGYEHYFTFDALNRAENVQGFYGATGSVDANTYYAYDAASNRLEVRVRNTESGSTVYRSSYHEYDNANRIRRAIDTEASTGAARGFVYYDFDLVGNRKMVVDQEGRPTYYTFDALNRESTRLDAAQDTWTTIYDGRSAVTKRIDPEGRTQYFEYDLQGRVSAQSDSLGNRSQTFYDARSQRMHFINARGNSTLSRFDLLGRQTHQIDALNGVRYYAYDEVGNQTYRIDEVGQTTYLTYDLLNRVQNSKDQAAAITYAGYDARSSLVKRVDADGRTAYYTYDGARRLTGQTFKNPVGGESTDNAINSLFDLVGNTTTVQDDTISTANYFEYDRLDRLTQKTTVSGAVYFAWDKSGKKTQLKDPDLRPEDFVYDSNGRLQKVQIANARTAYFEYDKAGMTTKRISPVTLPAAPLVYSYYKYDVAGRLSQLEHHKGSDDSLVNYFAYTRNPNGAVTQIVHEVGSYSYFDYDALDRQTKDERWNSSNTRLYGFLYNYDAASNRYFKYDEVAGTHPTSYFTFNNLNLMTKEWIHPTSGGDTNNYFAYDLSQRLTKGPYNVGSGEHFYYTYNQRNMVTQLQDFKNAGGGDATRSFFFNGVGERVGLIDGTAAPGYFSYDIGGQVIRENRAGNKTRYAQAGSPLEFVASDGSTTAAPSTDERGTIKTLVASGNPPGNSTWEFDRWGVLEGVNDAIGGSPPARLTLLPSLFMVLQTTRQFFMTPTGLYLPVEAGFAPVSTSNPQASIVTTSPPPMGDNMMPRYARLHPEWCEIRLYRTPVGAFFGVVGALGFTHACLELDDEIGATRFDELYDRGRNTLPGSSNLPSSSPTGATGATGQMSSAVSTGGRGFFSPRIACEEGLCGISSAKLRDPASVEAGLSDDQKTMLSNWRRTLPDLAEHWLRKKVQDASRYSGSRLVKTWSGEGFCSTIRCLRSFAAAYDAALIAGNIEYKAGSENSNTYVARALAACGLSVSGDLWGSTAWEDYDNAWRWLRNVANVPTSVRPGSGDWSGAFRF
jgi:YD repeat-containing protein